MKNIDTRYWIELSVVTLLMLVMGWIAFTFIMPEKYPPVLPVMLAIITITTIAGQVILTRLLDQKFSRFNSAFLIFKAVKIFVILLIILISYHSLQGDTLKVFLVATFLLYLVYLVFESRSLNRHSRNQADR